MRPRRWRCIARRFTSGSRKRRIRNQATNFSVIFGFANGVKMGMMRPVLRRGGRVAEGAPLLREYTSKGCRGFESPVLRHYLLSTLQSGFIDKLLKLIEKIALHRD